MGTGTNLPQKGTTTRPDKLSELSRQLLTTQSAKTSRELTIDLCSSGFTDVKRAIEEGTQLSVIARTQSGPVVQALIAILLAEFNSKLNVARPLNDDQIKDLSFQIAKEYWNYTIEDFACFFHLALRGTLSDSRDNVIRDRIDFQMIFNLLSVYDRKRLDKIKEFQEAWKNSNPDRQGATVALKGSDIERWLEKPPTRKELEERLGRALTPEEVSKYDIKED